MNIEIFSNEIRKYAPAISELLDYGLSHEEANDLIKVFELTKISSNKTDGKLGLFSDLFANYDYSSFEAGSIRFIKPIRNKDINNNNEFIIGNYEADYLVFNELTKEIYIREFSDINHVLLSCATNDEAFFKVLLISTSYRTMKRKEKLNLSQNELDDLLIDCVNAAGGEKYKVFCKMLMGNLKK